LISELVSVDMIRRELRDMAEAHGETVVRLASDSSYALSVRDDSERICLVAPLDSSRRKIVDVVTPVSAQVPSACLVELAEQVRLHDLSVAGFEAKCGLIQDSSGKIHSVFALPDELELDTKFYFNGSYDIVLPRRLVSTSDFVLIGARILSMCEAIEIGGDADFSECDFESFPDGAKFHRNLVVSRATMRRLPRGITVGRWLKMVASEVDTIPVSARIGHGIDAENSSLRIIPPGVEIPGDLKLSGTKAKRLSGLKIGGSLYVERVPGMEISDDCVIDGNIYTDEASMPKGEAHSRKTYLRVPFGYEKAGAARFKRSPS
jgi:hypothetical protein